MWKEFGAPGITSRIKIVGIESYYLPAILLDGRVIGEADPLKPSGILRKKVIQGRLRPGENGIYYKSFQWLSPKIRSQESPDSIAYLSPASHAGKPSPKVFLKRVQSSAEKDGLAAGMGKSAVAVGRSSLITCF